MIAITNYLKRFELMMKAGNYGQSSINNYVSCLHTFLERFKWKPSIKHISADEILNYLMAIENYNGRKHHHSAIKLFYKLVAHQPLFAAGYECQR